MPHDDPQQIYRIADLISRMKAGILTESESVELERWAALSDANRELFASWQQGAFLHENYRRFHAMPFDAAKRAMQSRIAAHKASRRRLRRRMAVGAIAVIAVFVCIGIFAPPRHTLSRGGEIAAHTYAAPVLHFEDSTILLDSALLVVEKGGVTVLYADGSSEVYTPGGSKATMNTVEVPNGSTYDFRLEDGTHVWLNAGSRLRYSVPFTDHQRKVDIVGEAYFEVAHEAGRPFVVTAGAQRIEVLGTAFNVDAYPLSEYVSTTLVSGVVKVSAAAGELVLEPGMQAVSSESTLDSRPVRVEHVISWREGMFVLEDRSLEDIMTTLARWYDFEVVYQNDQVRNVAFKGAIPRFGSFEKILDLLERTGEVRFEVKGKRVKVKGKDR